MGELKDWIGREVLVLEVGVGKEEAFFGILQDVKPWRGHKGGRKLPSRSPV